MNKNVLEFSPSVLRAIEEKRPVIAFESTIISHGMPYPQNLEVAKKLEKIARDLGVEPATICLMDGKIKIGLTDNDLEILATADNVQKVSRRDIARILAKNEIGATTVAATMICANLAGIKVFATGGIGGVHRFAETSFDISADLIEFSKTPVIVVSAGVKAILDIPKTLEYLETFGVPVYGFKTDKFPAFYSSESGLPVRKLDSIQSIADIYNKERELGFNNGMIIANPIPKTEEIPFGIMSKSIEEAVSEAVAQSIVGQEVTPYLLKRLVEVTKGKSLVANINLVENNVRVGCEIAKSL